MSPRKGLDPYKILRIAAEIVDQEGMDKLSLTNVAAKCQVRPPSLYNHFQGFADLQTQLAMYVMKKLEETLLRSAVGLAGDEAVLALGRAYRTFARQHPGLYEIILSAGDPKDKKRKQIEERIVDVIYKSLAFFALPKEEALHIVRGFRSLCHGFVSLEQKGGFGLNLDLEESFEKSIRYFLTGMKNFQKSSPPSSSNE